MRNLKTIVVGFLLFISSIVQAQHSEILVEKGEFNFNISSRIGFFNKVYDDDGEKKAVPKASTNEINLKSIYGISKHLNLSINIPYVINKAKGEIAADGGFKIDEKKSELGDIDFVFHYLFLNAEPWKIIIGISQSIATGKNNDAFG